jgi:5-methylcytosine-specific restriction endonuclease McrA
MRDSRRRFTARQARQIAIASGGKCGRCGKELPDGFHVHHVKAHSQGGQTQLGNAMALCPKCHVEVHRAKS